MDVIRAHQRRFKGSGTVGTGWGLGWRFSIIPALGVSIKKSLRTRRRARAHGKPIEACNLKIAARATGLWRVYTST